MVLRLNNVHNKMLAVETFGELGLKIINSAAYL